MSDLACVAGVSQSAGLAEGNHRRSDSARVENAGVIWIDANDGGPGARLRKAD
jgi:hypothetical protein